MNNLILKKKLAVFDIDGTIFRSSLLVELINALVRYRFFPQKAQKAVEKDHLAWLNRQGNYKNYINKVSQVYRHYLKGCSPLKIKKVAKEVVKYQRDRVYVFTRELIKYLKPNYYLLAVSGSPQEIVQEFSNYFGFDKVYSRVYEIEKKQKIYTGRILNENFISNKKKILKSFLAQTNFSLKDSLGVGDTESDIGFLKMVDYAIAFNPNRELAITAKKRNWLIVVERKDMIYYLL